VKSPLGSSATWRARSRDARVLTARYCAHELQTNEHSLAARHLPEQHLLGSMPLSRAQHQAEICFRPCSGSDSRSPRRSHCVYATQQPNCSQRRERTGGHVAGQDVGGPGILPIGGHETPRWRP
jgi:hypothetical protein